MANNGSVIIYHRLIKPFVKKHENEFDQAINQFGDIAKDVGKHGMFIVHVVIDNRKVCTTRFVSVLNVRKNNNRKGIVDCITMSCK